VKDVGKEKKETRSVGGVRQKGKKGRKLRGRDCEVEERNWVEMGGKIEEKRGKDGGGEGDEGDRVRGGIKR